MRIGFHHALATVALLGLGGCGGTPGVDVAPSEPLETAGSESTASIDANQQGTEPELPAADAVAGDGAGTASLGPMRDVMLWCDDPRGTACRAVSEAIKASPVTAASIPAELLVLEDLPDDCAAPGMEAIELRAGGAVSLSAGSWRDQVGDSVDRDAIGDMYMGSGCIHDADADAGRPVIKIHATRSPPRRYLVRVWEQGQGGG